MYVKSRRHETVSESASEVRTGRFNAKSYQVVMTLGFHSPIVLHSQDVAAASPQVNYLLLSSEVQVPASAGGVRWWLSNLQGYLKLARGAKKSA